MAALCRDAATLSLDKIFTGHKIKAMKSGWQQFFMAILATLALSVHGQSFSLYSVSNSASTNIFSANTGAVQSSIEMKNTLLGTGISRLSKQANVNLPLDQQVSDWWGVTDSQGRHVHEPVLNFSWTNLTAREALFRVLQEHRLVIDVNPITKSAQVSFMQEDKDNLPEEAN